MGKKSKKEKKEKSLRSACLRLPPSVPVAPEPPARHRRTRRAPTPESRTPSLTVTPSSSPRRTHKKKRSRRDDTSSSSSPSSESDSEDSEDVRRRRAAKMVRPRFVPSRHGTLIDDRLKPRRARSHTPRPPTFHPERRPRSSPRAKQGEVAGYTDAENPFGDANLTERFVWHKKIEKSLMSGVDAKELGLKAERRRHEERLKEIEKVKQQREQRERERVEKEEEREIMAREEALIEAVELEKKEEEFHLQQAKMRSDIRVKEGRARAIDLVSRNIHAEPGAPEFDFGVHPLEIFDGLTVSEMDELVDDLRNYEHLDREDARRGFFWSNMIAVADAELFEARRREDIDRARVRGVDTRDLVDHGLHASLDGEVRDMLEGKSFAELEELEGEIEASLRAPDAAESEYWTAVLRRVVTHKARVAVADATMKMRRAQSEARPREVPSPPPPSGAAGGRHGRRRSLGADFGRAAAEPGRPGTSPRTTRRRAHPPRAMSPEPMSPGGFTPEGTPDRCYSPNPFRPATRGPRGGGRGGGQGTSRGVTRVGAREETRKVRRGERRSRGAARRALGGARDVRRVQGVDVGGGGRRGALRPPPGRSPRWTRTRAGPRRWRRR